GELVTIAHRAHLGDAVGGTLHAHRVQAEPVGGEGQTAVAIEDVVGGGRADDRLDCAGAEPLDPVSDASDPTSALKLSRGPDDRGGEPYVRLDDRRDLVRGGAAADRVARRLGGL